MFAPPLITLENAVRATLRQNVSGKVTGISSSAHRLNGFVKLIG